MHKLDNPGKLRNMASLYLLCGNKMLLLYRQGSRVVNNLWIGSAGGHFEENELNNARACVLRELAEELSLTPDMIENLRLRYITLRNTGEEIRQNYYFFADLKAADNIDLQSNEGTLKWFPLEELNKLEMPFTAQYVVRHYVEQGRYTDILYAGIATEGKVVFTELSEK